MHLCRIYLAFFYLVTIGRDRFVEFTNIGTYVSRNLDESAVSDGDVNV